MFSSKITSGILLFVWICCIYLPASAQNADSLQRILDFERAKDTLIKIITSNNDIRAFNFVGGGDLNSIAQQGDASNAGNISVGLYYVREFPQNKILKDVEIDFALNVSSTVDSFTYSNPRSFGNYILNPINSKQSARLDFYSLLREGYSKKKNAKGEVMRDSITNKVIRTNKETWLSVMFDGVFARFYGSNSLWDFAGEDVSVTSVHFKLGLYHEFLPDAVARNSNSSVMLGVAGGIRAITGDIRSNTEVLDDQLKTRKGTYWGVDVVFGVKFNNIRAEFVVPFVEKGDNQSVLGLTDTQFVTQIRFVGGFPLGVRNPASIASQIKDIKP